MNTFENVRPTGADTKLSNYIQLAQDSPGYLPPFSKPGDVGPPRSEHPNDVIGFIEGNIDCAMQAVEGGAQFACEQIAAHPWETAGLVVLGAGVLAAAPIASAFGATAAVVAGIDAAVTTSGAGLGAIGVVTGVSEINFEMKADSTKAAYTLLTDLKDHSAVDLEVARQTIRDKLGQGTFEIALGAIGAAGGVLREFGLPGKLKHFGSPTLADLVPTPKAFTIQKGLALPNAVGLILDDHEHLWNRNLHPETLSGVEPDMVLKVDANALGTTESFRQPIPLDGYSNVVLRWTSIDEEKVVYKLYDDSYYLAIRRADGSLEHIDPGSTKNNILGPLLDQIAPN